MTFLSSCLFFLRIVYKMETGPLIIFSGIFVLSTSFPSLRNAEIFVGSCVSGEVEMSPVGYKALWFSSKKSTGLT